MSPKVKRVADSEAAGGAVADIVIPAKRPAVGVGVASPAPLQKPQVPNASSDAAKLGCLGIMKSLVPWVLQNLPLELFKHKKISGPECMQTTPPLNIPDAGQSKEVSSYKPPWSPAACHSSIACSGLYEAAGNVTWIDPETASWSLPGDDPSWAWLDDASVDLFRVVELNGKRRILFPVPLTCYWRRDVGVLQADKYPDQGGLHPLSGHAFMYAWYVACFKALDAGDVSRCLLLYECGLTATITLVKEEDKKALALESIRASERVHSQAQVLVDSFLTFAAKVSIFAEGKYDLKHLTSADLRYKGSKLNATMVLLLRACIPLRQESRRCAPLSGQRCACRSRWLWGEHARKAG